MQGNYLYLKLVLGAISILLYKSVTELKLNYITVKDVCEKLLADVPKCLLANLFLSVVKDI